MRQLALKLSAAGFHTLRFDFFGTGDSAGDMVDADIKGWETDVELAIREIKDIVGTNRVTLIGLRLGATIAASATATFGKDVEALILWDPIVSGEEYLRSLVKATQPSKSRLFFALADLQAPLEVQGFPLTLDLMREFESVDLRHCIFRISARTLMLVTERCPSHEFLLTLLREHGRGPFEIEFMTSAPPWIADPANIGMAPVEVVKRIVNWLE